MAPTKASSNPHAYYWCSQPVCEECGKCHYCNSAGGFEITSTPRTQKRKGLATLERVYDQHSQGHVTPIIGVIQNMKQAESIPSCAFKVHSKGVFARPCPKVPRHGFVDSRVVKSKEELLAVCKETFEVEPEGEVILAAPIEALWNAIWTPGLLTLGKGFDGATSGVDTINLPLVGVIPEDLKAVLKSAGIGEGEWPYIEVVCGKDDPPALTQLRAGPALAGFSANFIPFEVEVKRVVRAGGSLLEWEKLTEEIKDEKGVVVYHPGGSLADHYTVHARTHNIPVLLEGDEPKVGELLLPEGDTQPIDPTEVLKGLILGQQVKLSTVTQRKDALALLLLVLYNSGAMVGKQSRWIGIGACLMMRLGAMALAGEARHAGSMKGSREQVYSRNAKDSLTKQHARLSRLITVLRYAFPAGRVGVGGEKWAKCGGSLIPMFHSVRELAKEQTIENAQNLIRAYNVAVDQAHNGGWWLNKFGGQTMFDEVQKGHLPTLLMAGNTVMEIAELSIPKGELEKRQSRWMGWKDVKVICPKVTEASIVEVPISAGHNIGVNITLKSRLAKNQKTRTIQVPVLKLLSALKKDLLSSLFVREGEHGLIIEARHGSEVVPIYAEADVSKVKAGETKGVDMDQDYDDDED